MHISSLHLFAKVPPQITPFDFGVKPSNVGEMATVSCLVAKGDLPVDIIWSLNSIPIINGIRSVSVTRLNARTSALSIDALDAGHRGLFECIARNVAGYFLYNNQYSWSCVHFKNYNHTFPFKSLHTVPPSITPFDFGIEPANVGEVAMVSCMVAKGDLPLDIFWSLNSIPIVSGHHSFSVTRLNARTSALSIDSLDAQHRGLYKCMARNGAGHADIQSELAVNGASILLTSLCIMFDLSIVCLFFPVNYVPPSNFNIRW